ncbi:MULTISPECIES: hypothetical protein [Clostridium]|uniref:Uncharacterized protein n=1 Tax=Clostridium frigoriphilum TaxID=443253 RepID=A0ABU7UUC7_9CLOT|nr:hypothetical protein [Clostridium sp. DSM 17811]MBU3102387.1 hypothetical protein [Clostridium sp. DSM 17811]
MKKIEELTPYELATLASTVAVIISKDLDVNQQNVIGNFILSMGVNISTIASQSEYLSNQEKNKNPDNCN